MTRKLLMIASVAVLLSIPGSLSAAALVLGPSFPGQLNGGNLSVAVNGNGVTTGCINFYNVTPPDNCNAPASFKVIQPLDPSLFVFNSTGTIADIPAPPSVISHFLTLPGQQGGATIFFDLTAIVMPTPVACPPATTPGVCAVGDFIFQQNASGSVTVAFTVLARAYTGTAATGFTPYAITFSAPFNGFSIAQLITTVANGGTITDAVSFNAAPLPNPFTGCSVTQGGWGAAPHGNNPGALLASKFTTVYPNGVTIGDAGSQFFLHFSSAAAIQAFLPQGGPPGALTASATNPTTSSAGVLAGQVLALKLNVDIEGMGGLIISGTGTSLDGKTVSDVLAAANVALGGGALPAGFSLSSLNDLVDSLNNAFDGCVADSFALTHLH
jgi:hypothetical protein